MQLVTVVILVGERKGKLHVSQEKIENILATSMHGLREPWGKVICI